MPKNHSALANPQFIFKGGLWCR